MSKLILLSSTNTDSAIWCRRAMHCSILPDEVLSSTYLHMSDGQYSECTQVGTYRWRSCNGSKAQSSLCPDNISSPRAQRLLWWQVLGAYWRYCWTGYGYWSPHCRCLSRTLDAADGGWPSPSPPDGAPWIRVLWTASAEIPSHRQTGCLYIRLFAHKSSATWLLTYTLQHCVHGSCCPLIRHT